MSFLSAWLNPLPVGFRLALSACVLLSLWLALRRHRAGAGVTGLRLQPDKSWILQLGDAEVEASLLGSSLATPWLVLLHFRTQTGRLSLLLCRDGLDPDAFRRLRVALKISGKPGGAEPVNL